VIWNLFGTIGDDSFKADLKGEMAGWSPAQVVEYADALDLVYLSVLKQSRIEKAAAKLPRKISEAEEAARKKREAVKEDIRRVESNETNDTRC
jgi:sRNA-binding protein